MLTNLISKIKDHANNNKFYTENETDGIGHNLDMLDKEDGELVVIKKDLFDEAADFIFSHPEKYERFNFFDAINAVISNPFGLKSKFLAIDLLLAKENEEYFKLLNSLDFSKIDDLLVSWKKDKDEEDIDAYINDLKFYIDNNYERSMFKW